MSTKLNNLDELTNIVTQKEKTDAGVLVFSKEFKIGRLLKPFASVKKQGYTLVSVLVAMILSRLGGLKLVRHATNRQFANGRQYNVSTDEQSVN
jgi:hypothetical protein